MATCLSLCGLDQRNVQLHLPKTQELHRCRREKPKAAPCPPLPLPKQGGGGGGVFGGAGFGLLPPVAALRATLNARPQRDGDNEEVWSPFGTLLPSPAEDKRAAQTRENWMTGGKAD